MTAAVEAATETRKAPDRDGLRLGLWLLATLHLGLGLVGLLTLRLQPGALMRELAAWTELEMEGGDLWTEALSLWQRWDALWYQRIVEQGYAEPEGTAAFFPLYPLFVRVASVATPDAVVPAAVAVSAAAFVAAIMFLYRLARADGLDTRASTLGPLFVAFFPTGFFLIAPYAEALFLALAAAAFWYARASRPWLAGALGLVAALARPPGAFLAFPLAAEYFMQRRASGRRPNVDLLAALLPLLGLPLFALYLRAVGQAESPIGAQALWGIRLAPPWEVLADSWSHVSQRGDPIEALNLVSLVGAAVVTAVAARRWRISYGVYVVPMLALLSSRELENLSPLMSVSRLVLVLFPCFFAIAELLGRRPRLAAAWLAVSLFLEAALFAYWARWGFVA